MSPAEIEQICGEIFGATETFVNQRSAVEILGAGEKLPFSRAKPHTARWLSRSTRDREGMAMIDRTKRPPRRRPGYSLLEVVLASTICLTALVPALALLRDGMANATKIDTRHRLLIYGVSKLEEQLAIVAATWSTGSSNGDFAAEGASAIRFSATRSDSAGSGGITNRLMSVSVTVYGDDNANATLDAGELSSTFTTKVSKLVNYETMAGS
jgi:hypothetical protein